MKKLLPFLLVSHIILSLFTSCATVFPEHEITQNNPDAQCPKCSSIAVSGKMKSKPFEAPSSASIFFLDLIFLRTETAFYWEGTVQIDEKETALSFKMIKNGGAFEGSTWNKTAYVENLSCGKIEFECKAGFDSNQMPPMEEFGYFITGGKVYFVYVATKDGLGGANIMHNPTNVKFVIECESSKRVCEIYTDKKILDKYQLKGNFNDSAEDEILKLLSGITASFYKAALDCMNVKVEK
ncbi:hypothetical protein [Treponema zioleckii]|uniref:hypothetical protein n=1 Tax=Treponema zioleckii TaxID=331680 RepID=UPI00168A9F3D|nr:hypothetical protein [Treponema zioleckii]